MRETVIYRFSTDTSAIDMTPVVDIVFLLIIFFMLVCQFFSASDIQVDVPQRIRQADAYESLPGQAVVTAVMNEGNFVCMVANARLNAAGGNISAERISQAINAQLGDFAGPGSVAILRIDRDVRFEDYRQILLGAGSCRAEQVKIAVLRD